MIPALAIAAIHWPTSVGSLAGGNEVSATSVVSKLFSAFITVAAIASVAALIFAGYQYMTSRANPDTMKKAKDRIVWALVGFVIVILAYSIVNVVRNLPFFSGDGTVDDPFTNEEQVPNNETP